MPISDDNPKMVEQTPYIKTLKSMWMTVQKMMNISYTTKIIAQFQLQG